MCLENSVADHHWCIVSDMKTHYGSGEGPVLPQIAYSAPAYGSIRAPATFLITKSSTTKKSASSPETGPVLESSPAPETGCGEMERGQRQALVQDLASHDHLRLTSYAEADGRVGNAISLET